MILTDSANKRMKNTFQPVILLAISLFLTSCVQQEKGKTDSDQERIDAILARIMAPEFPNTIFKIPDFGAVADGTSDSRPAIQQAVSSCSENGGGRVLIPAGSYFCAGPIHLEDNVELHLEEDAVVNFSQDPADYLPTVLVRWEGVECYNYSPYVYARDKKNIAITGKGKFNGNAAGGIFQWRELQKPSQDSLRRMGRKLLPVEQRVFGEGHFLRPAFVHLVNCQNVLISDIRVENMPFWIIQPTYCRNVTVKGIRVNSRNINNDGVDPDSSEDVLIEDCWFRTGDDAIAIKSGRDQDGWRVNKPSRNIVIRNCHAELTLHGIALGSEMSGGVENVYIRNFTIGKADKYALQFKSNKDRGAYIRNVSIDGLVIDTALTAVLFTNDYHSYAGGNSPSEFHSISIRNLHCTVTTDLAIDMVGLPEQYIHDVDFENVHVEEAGKIARAEYTNEIRFSEVNINNVEIKTLSDLEAEGLHQD